MDLRNISVSDDPTPSELQEAATTARHNMRECASEATRYEKIAADLDMRAQRILTGVEGSSE